MCRGTIKRISNFHFLGLLHDFVQEFLINGLLDKNSARSDAVLAFIEENSSHGRFDSSIQVKISKNDQGTFAAQLQGSFLQIGHCARFHDGFAHRRRTRKSKFTNQRVIRDSLACNFKFFKFRTSGCDAMQTLPATDPDPVTTLMTPGGMPALCDNSANLRAVRGHTAAGLMTTVLPAAKQAAIFQESIIKG